MLLGFFVVVLKIPKDLKNETLKHYSGSHRLGFMKFFILGSAADMLLSAARWHTKIKEKNNENINRMLSSVIMLLANKAFFATFSSIYSKGKGN